MPMVDEVSGASGGEAMEIPGFNATWRDGHEEWLSAK